MIELLNLTYLGCLVSVIRYYYLVLGSDKCKKTDEIRILKNKNALKIS
jgi:hypothetical protein